MARSDKSCCTHTGKASTTWDVLPREMVEVFWGKAIQSSTQTFLNCVIGFVLCQTWIAV